MTARMTDVGVRLRADPRGLQTDLRRGTREWSRYGKHVEQVHKKTRQAQAMGGGFKAGARKGVSLVEGAIGAGVAFKVKAEINKVKEFESALIHVGTTAGVASRRDLTKLRDQILSTSDAWGVGKSQVLQFTNAIVEQTGDLSLATKSMDGLAKVAYATSASMEDLGSVGVQLTAKLGIGPEKWAESFDFLASQANRGSVELKDMAQEFPKLLNMAAAFGHKGQGALKAWGAIVQVARRATGSVSEASTAVERMAKQLQVKRAGIEKTLGIKLKKDGAWLQLPEMMELISERMVTLGKTGKDAQGKVFDAGKFGIKTFDAYGSRVINLMVQMQKAGKFNADSIGGQATFMSLIKGAGTGTIDEMAKTRKMLNPELDAWNKAMNRFQNQMHRVFLPMMNSLAKVMPDVAKLMGFFVNHLREITILLAAGKISSVVRGMRAGGSAGGAAVGASQAGGGGVGESMSAARLLGRRSSAAAGGTAAPADQGFYSAARGPTTWGSRGRYAAATSDAGRQRNRGGWVRQGRSGGMTYVEGSQGAAPGSGGGAAWGAGQGNVAPRQGGLRGAYGRFKGSHVGRNAAGYGMAGALAGQMIGKTGLGGKTGGMVEGGLDTAASVAMMAGGPAGLIAGGGYFAAKGIFKIGSAVLNTEKLDYSKEAAAIKNAGSATALRLRGENVGYQAGTGEAAGGAVKAALQTGNVMAMQQTKAQLQAQLQARVQKLTGGTKEGMELFNKTSDSAKQGMFPGIAALEASIKLLERQMSEQRKTGVSTKITKESMIALGKTVAAGLSAALTTDKRRKPA